MESINLNCLVFDQTEQKAYFADKKNVCFYYLPEPKVLSLITTNV